MSSTQNEEFASAELAMIAEFLRDILPFNELSHEQLAQVVGKIIIHYHCQGDTFNANSDEPGLRIVRSGAVDIRDDNNKLLDRLGEGEHFNIDGLNIEQGGVSAAVIEDTLIYRLPTVDYDSLRQSNRNIDRYFCSQRNRRLRRAARYESSPNAMMQEVRSVMTRDLLSVVPDDTVQSVAQKMSEHRVSSAFVLANNELVGIITDRDLRMRYVSKALPPTTLIGDIMTPNPQAIDASNSIFDTTLLMTRCGFHHLPVMENNKLAGIVTTSDLILAKQDDPVYLVQHISRQHDISAIADLVAGMPNLLVQWVQSGMKAQQISKILTAISDAITVRLIQLAEEQLGPAPVPWCWLGFGSQARAEQLLGADQDNGIVIANELTAADADWFTQLATIVCDGLNTCGYVYCPGDIMATTEQWRQTLATWQETVKQWAKAPTPDATMRVSIFFDLRAIYGSTELCEQLQTTMLQQASSNTIFQAALADNALSSTPPLGIFRRFVVDRDGEHRDNLDLKKRGVLPITEIVRLHSLANSITAVNTEERIQALVTSKHMNIGDSRNLIDALHFIQQQRIQHQCEQIVRGKKVTNFINPKHLSKMGKEQLRDAFKIIDDAQTSVRLNYRGGL